MTKEQRREYDKAYNIANRDKIAAKVKRHYESNKEKIADRRKAYYKDDFYTLYYLKEEHYIGQTNQPKLRINNHRVKGKHVLDYEAVATFNTKREALDAERYLHSIGYNGGNPRNFKNNS